MEKTMEESIKDLVKQTISEQLTVEFKLENDYDYDKLRVTISLDGEEVSNDYVYVEGGHIKW